MKISLLAFVTYRRVDGFLDLGVEVGASQVSELLWLAAREFSQVVVVHILISVGIDAVDIQ